MVYQKFTFDFKTRFNSLNFRFISFHIQKPEVFPVAILDRKWLI